MTLNLCYDLLGCLVVWIPILTCGRRTGVPVDSLVSGEEQNTATLEALNAGVGIVWVAPILGG